MIEKEVTNESTDSNKTEIKIENEKTDEKAPEPKKEEQTGYTDQDIADVKYTPRKDDN